MYFICMLFSPLCLKDKVHTHSVLLVWHMSTVFSCDIEMHSLMSFYMCMIFGFTLKEGGLYTHYLCCLFSTYLVHEGVLEAHINSHFRDRSLMFFYKNNKAKTWWLPGRQCRYKTHQGHQKLWFDRPMCDYNIQNLEKLQCK